MSDMCTIGSVLARCSARTAFAIARLRVAGATVLAVEPGAPAAGRLPYADPGHPFLEPVTMVQSFYRCAEETARLRGRDPDRPRMLRKVTETV